MSTANKGKTTTQAPKTTTKAATNVQAPENWKKREEREQKFKVASDKVRADRKKKNTERKAEWLKKAQTYATEYKKFDLDEIENQRKARHSG